MLHLLGSGVGSLTRTKTPSPLSAGVLVSAASAVQRSVSWLSLFCGMKTNCQALDLPPKRAAGIVRSRPDASSDVWVPRMRGLAYASRP
eukprot:2988492-Prymnesium_polylepis.1